MVRPLLVKERADSGFNASRTNPGKGKDICKYTVPSWHGITLNISRAASPLVRLVEKEEKWEALDQLQDVLPQNWGDKKSYCLLDGAQS
ncbi:hypothetical protein TNCV_1389491 [Trichonephila clavipes]|nr:hypothetical protein TNCV_1389491 [Trichonephila clavipes]